MEFSGTYLFFAGRDRVWQALNSTEVLQQAIPGCDHIAWNSPSTLDLVIRVNLGVARPKFSGELELSDVREARDYVLSGRGRGGILGLARGAARISLRDRPLEPAHFRALEQALENVPGAGDNPRSLLSVPGEGEAGTVLSFSATGGASNQIMALGRSLVGKSAQGVIDRFMGRFSDAMQAPMLVLAPGEGLEGEPRDTMGQETEKH